MKQCKILLLITAVLLASCLLVSMGSTAVLAKEKEIVDEVGSTEQLGSYFDSIGYNVAANPDILHAVPRFRFTHIPKHWEEDTSVPLKKSVFFRAGASAVLQVNESLMHDRQRLSNIKLNDMSQKDGKWLTQMMSTYKETENLRLLTGIAMAGQEGTFAGTWTASGTYQPLEFAQDREVFTFRLSGHVNLKTQIGEVGDLWSECVGLWDALIGSTTRCVWRDPGGEDAAYCLLEGRLVEEGVRVTGQFVGGTGRLNGLTGNLSFTWRSVFRNPTDHILTGHTENLTGSYKLP